MNIKSFNFKNLRDALFRLFLSYGIFQLFLHIYFLVTSNDPKMLVPTIISFVYDLFILSFFYLFGFYSVNVMYKDIKQIFLSIYFCFYLLIGLLLSVYPGVLREYLIFPVNIFEADANVTETLVVEYLGFSTFIPVIIGFVIALFMAFYVKKDLDIFPKVKYTFIVFVFLFSLFFLQKGSPHPFIYSLQSQVESLLKNEHRVVKSLSYSKKENYNIITTIKYPSDSIIQYKNIIIVVLEGVTSKSFENEFMNIENGFYKSFYKNAKYYSNYFTNNLDSYTSLIAMISSIHVPYRSYADVEFYENVNKAKNLVEYFKLNKYQSLFVSTFEHQPFIPSKSFWDNIYTRKDFQISDKFLTIGSSRMEKATEDKVAIDKIINYTNRNNKTFILHEMAYGHSPEWRATSGISQLQYYNDYLTELTNKLSYNNSLDSTLIVIVSDHGDRSKIADSENYRVPLLIVGKTIINSTDNTFLSHLNLSTIIFNSVNKASDSIVVKAIYTVGSSEKWTYGKIKSNGESIFINDTKGSLLSNKGNINAKEVKDSFQIYINEFNYKFGKK